jgi:hypothetical protein
MTTIKRLLLLLIIIGMTGNCKNKKKVIPAGEDPVKVEDFISFFQLRQLPYSLTDTILKRKENDSLKIRYEVFTRFVPDTFLSQTIGKNIKPVIYPLGRIEEGSGTYLFAKAVTSNKRIVYILAFDRKKQFIAGMPALQADQASTGSRSLVMDKRYTITRTVNRRNANGSTSEGRDVYMLNSSSKNFELIMTDALDDRLTELINPIDTFSRKNKFSADYASGKMNLVSIRDGRKPGRLNFFIHFEKNGGECTGELKGEATIRSATTAEYREDGDPCVMRFIFSSASVTVKEEQGCGSHRGLRCSFDGNFAKKKVPTSGTKKPVKKTNS